MREKRKGNRNRKKRELEEADPLTSET